MKIINKLAALVALTGVIALAPSALASTILWNQAGSSITTNVVVTDFDNATMTFAGVLVGDFTGVTSATALLHDHGTGTTVFKMDLRLNGLWTNVWTFDPVNSSNYLISSFGGLNIGSAVLDGIRFTASPLVSQAYHGFANNTAFNFAAAVPDGGSTMAFLGLALTAIAFFRRQQLRSV